MPISQHIAKINAIPMCTTIKTPSMALNYAFHFHVALNFTLCTLKNVPTSIGIQMQTRRCCILFERYRTYFKFQFLLSVCIRAMPDQYIIHYIYTYVSTDDTYESTAECIGERELYEKQ